MSHQLGLGATVADIPELVTPEDTNAAMRVMEDRCWEEMTRCDMRFREWGLNITDQPHAFVEYFTLCLVDNDVRTLPGRMRYATLCEKRAAIIRDYTAYRIAQAQEGAGWEWFQVLEDMREAA